MAHVDYSEGTSFSTKGPSFNRIKLEKGEIARIALLEGAEYFFVHDLRPPLLFDGKPKTEINDYGNKVYERGFLSRYLCTGDTETMIASGADPDNCIMCAYRIKNPSYLERPKPRFATNVLRYKTKPGTDEPIEPFSAEAVVWIFTEKNYEKLVALKKTWKDLRMHDLVLGPCNNPKFQNYDIEPRPDAAWMANEATQKLTIDILKANRLEDLSVACGKKGEDAWIKNDLDKLTEAWTDALKAENATAAAGSATEVPLDNGLSDLLAAAGTPVSVSPAPVSLETLSVAAGNPPETDDDDTEDDGEVDLEGLLASLK